MGEQHFHGCMMRSTGYRMVNSTYQNHKIIVLEALQHFQYRVAYDAWEGEQRTWMGALTVTIRLRQMSREVVDEGRKLRASYHLTDCIHVYDFVRNRINSSFQEDIGRDMGLALDGVFI